MLGLNPKTASCGNISALCNLDEISALSTLSDCCTYRRTLTTESSAIDRRLQLGPNTRSRGPFCLTWVTVADGYTSRIRTLGQRLQKKQRRRIKSSNDPTRCHLSYSKRMGIRSNDLWPVGLWILRSRYQARYPTRQAHSESSLTQAGKSHRQASDRGQLRRVGQKG